MANKRKAENVHPSRQGQVPSEPAPKREKRQHVSDKPFKKKAHPVNELKSRIRSVKRLLSRSDKLPADIRVEKERELQTAQHELRAAEKAGDRSKMIGRYHKIRFFDRQKATKRLKRARKDLEAFDAGEGGTLERKVLAERIEDATTAVNYAQYYPLDRPYVSLFPRTKVATAGNVRKDGEDNDDGKDADGTAAERKGDPEMWQQVQQSEVDGTLDALRNGKLLPLHRSPEPPEKNPYYSQHTRQEVAAEKRIGSAPRGQDETSTQDDESDGGFFE